MANMSQSVDARQWPDKLNAPKPDAIQRLLVDFWQEQRILADQLARGEQLLAASTVSELRTIVLSMMLALNGIERPAATRHLNDYLSENQRRALEQTLKLPAVDADSWIGQAVALTVIYRWYAPQLVERHNLVYPQRLEEEVWSNLRSALPAWPAEVTTD